MSDHSSHWCLDLDMRISASKDLYAVVREQRFLPASRTPEGPMAPCRRGSERAGAATRGVASRAHPQPMAARWPPPLAPAGPCVGSPAARRAERPCRCADRQMRGRARGRGTPPPVGPSLGPGPRGRRGEITTTAPGKRGNRTPTKGCLYLGARATRAGRTPPAGCLLVGRPPTGSRPRCGGRRHLQSRVRLQGGARPRPSRRA